MNVAMRHHVFVIEVALHRTCRLACDCLEVSSCNYSSYCYICCCEAHCESSKLGSSPNSHGSSESPMQVCARPSSGRGGGSSMLISVAASSSNGWGGRAKVGAVAIGR